MTKQPNPRSAKVNGPKSDTLGRGQSSAEAVTRALDANPGSTAAQLATAAGLGRSTATRALAALEADGQARRKAGGRDGARRLPDRWNPTARNSSAADGDRPSTSPTHPRADESPRLGKGVLGAMVLEYLTSHPEDEVGPTAVGHALDRSVGAVANALTRLVNVGSAELTNEAPRRYTVVR